MDEIEQIETESKQVSISFKNKMIFLAIFGALLGFVIKTEAAKRITVGFEDYKLQEAEKTFNIGQLQKELEQGQTSQIENENVAEDKSEDNQNISQ